MLAHTYFSVLQFEQWCMNGNRKRLFLLVAVLCAALLLYLGFVVTPLSSSDKVQPVNLFMQPDKNWIPYTYKKFKSKVDQFTIHLSKKCHVFLSYRSYVHSCFVCWRFVGIP